MKLYSVFIPNGVSVSLKDATKDYINSLWNNKILSQMNNFQKLSGKLHPHLLQDTQDKRRDSARPYGRPEF